MLLELLTFFPAILKGMVQLHAHGHFEQTLTFNIAIAIQRR